MITAAVTWLIERGVPAKLARPLLVAGAILALLAVLGLVWSCSVDNAVDNRIAEQTAENEKQARAADGKAAEQARQDDKRARAEGEELERITGHEPDRSLTDSERALLRCVRLQQSARANGEPAPAC